MKTQGCARRRTVAFSVNCVFILPAQMKNFLLALSLVFSLPFVALAQQHNITTGPVERIPLGAVLQPSQGGPDWAPVFRNIWTAPVPAGSAGIEAEKARANALRDAQYPPVAEGTRSTAASPDLLKGFAGNNFDGGLPNDNELAVSPSGYVVSATNSQIHVYSTGGQRILARSLQAFSSGISTRSGLKYDPRVSYDAIADRFVVVYLSGARSNNSEVIVCMSASGDPTGAWNAYAIGGNLRPNNVDVWSDYPNIGISQEELFITCNLFDNNNSFQAAGVWQIRLSDGYNAQPLTLRSYTLQGAFSLAPAQHQGASVSASNFFFVAKPSNGSGSSILVYEINNTLGANGQLQTPLTFSTGALNYTVPPNAPQRGASHTLGSGDGRIGSAFRMGRNIYFVMGTGYRGRSAIFMGHLQLSPIAPTFSRLNSAYLWSDTLDLSYPSITYAGISSSSGVNACMIGFNCTSSKLYPGCGVIYVDTLGQYSAPLVCKLSNNASANIGGGSYRWGDYTDITSAPDGSVWLSAYVFDASGNNNTWIAQVQAPGTVASSLSRAQHNISAAVYPVPAGDRLFLDFEVSEAGYYEAAIYDMQGRMIRQLSDNRMRPGMARLAFNTAALPPGNYVAVVLRDGKRVFSRNWIKS